MAKSLPQTVFYRRDRGRDRFNCLAAIAAEQLLCWMFVRFVASFPAEVYVALPNSLLVPNGRKPFKQNKRPCVRFKLAAAAPAQRYGQPALKSAQVCSQILINPEH